jgi:hypothetical protein
MNARRVVLVAIFSALLASCGSDEQGANAETECEPGFSFNPIFERCEPDRTVTGGDAGGTNNDTDVGVADDAGQTTPDMGDMPPNCVDGDGDGVCVEDDCDDTLPQVAPGLPEVCDPYDNDCNDVLNDLEDGGRCGFFAHTNEALYFVDPFAYAAEKVADTPTVLLDIDTHPDGRLFGILADFTLAVFNEQTNVFEPLPNGLGANVGNANGLAINNDGRVFLTSSGTLFTADLTTGIASEIGQFAPYISSGDTVVTKGNSLLMTSSHTDTDSLIRLDGNTGMGTLRGDTGVDAIWGLTSAYGVLYGLTSSGRLVIIDETTGAATIIHTFDGLSFYGAASTPLR